MTNHREERYKVIIDNITKIVEARKQKSEELVVTLEGKKYRIRINKISDNKLLINVDDEVFTITFDEEQELIFVDGYPYRARIIKEPVPIVKRSIRMPFIRRTVDMSSKKVIVSPITGKVLDILVKPGDKVSRGEVIAVIESMKIRNEIASDKDGVIKRLFINVGQVLRKGEKIAEIE